MGTGHDDTRTGHSGGSTGALVLPLAALDRGAIAICGGKAANLGELTAAGFPVPEGFCVTTAAYALATRIPALDEVIAEIAGAPATDTALLATLAGRAREIILSAEVPGEVRAACVAEYAALGEGEGAGDEARAAGADVAVRSSATAEDLPDASFAGQQDTYLHLRGEKAVLDGVRRCWASLWTDRAVAYRARNGVDPRGVRLAVVVQRMVPAAVAGVLFTADPITGRRRRAVIDASPGLGEAVVSGAVNPDHFEVETETLEIAARRLGDKRVAIEAAPGGGTRRVERAAASDEACLSDEEIRALALLGAKVEAHYRAPQDIEWALDASRGLRLLQARPITTLYPLPEGAPGTNAEVRLYLSFNVAQGVLRPLTPMGIQLLRLVGAGIADRLGFPVDEPERGPALLQEAASRLLIDLTVPARNDLGRLAIRFAFKRMEARSEALLDALFADPRLSVIPSSKLRLAGGVARALARTRLPVNLARYLARPSRAPARVQALTDAALAIADVPASASPEERLSAVARLFSEGLPRALPGIMPSFAGGLLCWLLAKRLLAGSATAEELETAFRALPHNPTTEMDLALWALAARAREDEASLTALRGAPPRELAERYRRGALPEALQRGLAELLDVYGARGVAEIDAGVPRWRDDPTHLLGALANYTAHDPEALAPDAQFEKARREAEQMVTELGRRARDRGVVRGAVVGFALSRMRALAGLREAPKFHIVRMFGRARELLLDVGRTLVESRRLDDANDVFLLDLAEVRAALRGKDLRALAAERREEHAREMGRKHLPRLLLSDGTDPEAAQRSGAGGAGDVGSRLTGAPASAGRVTARARVILDPTGAQLLHGEILVAPSTDPGWTPLFLTAGGLVMEMGGAMSHGAVVAREYGIPAVVGVPNATERIQTGQTITVDGAAGTIDVETAAGAR